MDCAWQIICIYPSYLYRPVLSRPACPFWMAAGWTTILRTLQHRSPTKHMPTTRNPWKYYMDVLIHNVSYLYLSIYIYKWYLGNGHVVLNKSWRKYITGFNTTRFGANRGALFQVRRSSGPRVWWRASTHPKTFLYKFSIFGLHTRWRKERLIYLNLRMLMTKMLHTPYNINYFMNKCHVCCENLSNYIVGR